MWLYDSTFEVVQYVLNILAGICSCCIHLYIIIRLIASYEKLSHYRNFVVVQSTVYIMDSVTMLLTNYVYCDGVLTYGQPFLQLSPTAVGVVMCAMEFFSRLKMTLLAIFNIYRTSIIVRLHYAVFIYLVVVIISIMSYAASLISEFTQIAELRYIALLLISSGVLPTIACYFIIRRHFREINSSDNVKKMQSKLSLGLLLQCVLQMASIFIMWSGFAFNGFFLFSFDNSKTLEAAVDIYFIIADMFMTWIPAITGLLIRWSISGFLQGKTRTSSISVQAFPPRKKSTNTTVLQD